MPIVFYILYRVTCHVFINNIGHCIKLKELVYMKGLYYPVKKGFLLIEVIMSIAISILMSSTVVCLVTDIILRAKAIQETTVCMYTNKNARFLDKTTQKKILNIPMVGNPTESIQIHIMQIRSIHNTKNPYALACMWYAYE